MPPWILWFDPAFLTNLCLCFTQYKYINFALILSSICFPLLYVICLLSEGTKILTPKQTYSIRSFYFATFIYAYLQLSTIFALLQPFQSLVGFQYCWLLDRRISFVCFQYYFLLPDHRIFLTPPPFMLTALFPFIS